MTVIAKRKEGLDWLYGIIGMICLFLFIIMLITDSEPILAIFLLIVGVASTYLFITHKKTPKDMISVDESTGEIYLHIDKLSISVTDVVDISYDKARARGIQYEWGTLIIETGIEKFEYQYVADVESVSKELTRIMYLHKNK